MVDLSTVRVEIPVRARSTILHVTEAMGGGLEAALLDFIRSAPQFRHAILFTRRGEFTTADRPEQYADQVIDAGRGVQALLHAYLPTVRAVQPEVIHLHSAWAGLVGRSLPTGGAPIVYSPHSYFFDRRDVPAPVRWLARGVERALSARTAAVAAVSPLEAQAARRMHATAHYVPNVVRLPEQLRWTGPAADLPPEVIAIGRLAEQKDPSFFREVVRLARPQLPGVRWTWIGGGEGGAAAELRADGVEVTGWIAREECLERLCASTAYLHTAAWEGNPITLLEAAAVGAPIVARSIPALDSLGFDPSLRTAEAVARRLVETIRGEGAPVDGVVPGPAADVGAQARALAHVYDSVLAHSPAAIAVFPRGTAVAR